MPKRQPVFSFEQEIQFRANKSGNKQPKLKPDDRRVGNDEKYNNRICE